METLLSHAHAIRDAFRKENALAEAYTEAIGTPEAIPLAEAWEDATLESNHAMCRLGLSGVDFDTYMRLIKIAEGA